MHVQLLLILVLLQVWATHIYLSVLEARESDTWIEAVGPILQLNARDQLKLEKKPNFLAFSLGHDVLEWGLGLGYIWS